MTAPTVDEIYALGLGETSDRFAGPLQRLLYLRASPNLSAIRGLELTALAQHSREHFFPEGSVVYDGGPEVVSAHFIVEGTVDLPLNDVPYRTIDAPWALGMLPMFAGVGAHAVARHDTRTLEIGRDRLFEVMEDNFRFLHGALAQLLVQFGEAQRTLELRGQLVRSAPESVPYPDGELDIVQRIGILRRGPYANVNLEPLAELARRAQELRVEDGHVLWREGDPSSWGCHIVHGVARCIGEHGQRNFEMGPGSVIGYFESHAGNPRPYTATVEGSFVALTGTSETFFNVLEDNFELGMGFLAFLSRGLLELYAKLGNR